MAKITTNFEQFKVKFFTKKGNFGKRRKNLFPLPKIIKRLLRQQNPRLKIKSERSTEKKSE